MPYHNDIQVDMKDCFEDARTVGGVFTKLFRRHALHPCFFFNKTNTNSFFEEAVQKAQYSPKQLRSLLVMLIVDAAPAVSIIERWSVEHTGDFWE